MIAEQSEFFKWLIDAGLVPPDRHVRQTIGDVKSIESVVETLLSAWSDRHARANAPDARRRTARIVQVLERCRRPDAACWTTSDPRVPASATRWLGERIWWCFGPLPAGRRIAVVSSRLPRLIDPHGPWMQALRAGLERLHQQEAVAVTGHGSAGYEFILRGACRRRIPTIAIHCCDLQVRSAAAWARHWRTQLETESAAHSLALRASVPAGPVTDLWALPPDSTPKSPSRSRSDPVWAVAERDRAAVAWADMVIVLGLRTGGNLHTLVRRRLQEGPADIVLVDFPGLQSLHARDDLVQLGAKLWALADQAPTQIPAASSPPHPSSFLPTAPNNQQSEIKNQKCPIPLPSATGWDFLTHTTRACVGPWPKQSRDDYVDSLLDARPDADHSPLAALLRIVLQRMLIASDRTIRRGFPVVSFTAVPLAEIPRLRVFRSHRGRWDFEPYGICISRRWLKAHGAQPVIYTGNSDWSRLSDAEQPFFQYVRHLDSTKVQPNQRAAGIDWSLEREWRHVGDLGLSDLTAADAMLFVPTAGETRKLLEISPWPVTVLT